LLFSWVLFGVKSEWMCFFASAVDVWVGGGGVGICDKMLILNKKYFMHPMYLFF